MPKGENVMIVTDSMSVCADNHETQLLCSPSQLLNTSMAMETLEKVDQMDQSRQQEVCLIWQWPNIYTYNVHVKGFMNIAWGGVHAA